MISRGVTTKTSELSDIYNNVLVAIDLRRGINNGEPALHAAWIDAVIPQPGETVIHVGARISYYTAILARLTEPGGHVKTFGYEADLTTEA